MVNTPNNGDASAPTSTSCQPEQFTAVASHPGSATDLDMVCTPNDGDASAPTSNSCRPERLAAVASHPGGATDLEMVVAPSSTDASALAGAVATTPTAVKVGVIAAAATVVAAIVGALAVVGASFVTGHSTVEGAKHQANGQRVQASAVRYAANVKAETDLSFRLLAACQATKQPCQAERERVDKLLSRIESK